MLKQELLKKIRENIKNENVAVYGDVFFGWCKTVAVADTNRRAETYYIKENELTGFENIVKSEYPELGYNICRSSKKASITVYEKEKEDVLFHATLKK